MTNSTSPSEPFKRFLAAFIAPMSHVDRLDGYDVQTILELSAQEQSQAEDLLTEQLEQGNTDERIVLALGELRSRRAIPFLEARLQATRGTGSVVKVAEALWRIIQSPIALGVLIEALASELHWSWRIDAAICLRQCRCQQAEQALQKALADEEYLVRYHAANSLLTLYDVPLPPPSASSHPLARAVMSQDSQTREAAIADILALGEGKSFPMCGEA